MATRDNRSADAILSIGSVFDLFENEDENFVEGKCQKGRQRGEERKFVVQLRLNCAKKLALKGGYFCGFVQAPARGGGQQH